MSAVPSTARPSFAHRAAPQAATTEGLYERHAAKIFSYCRHQLGSREEAEDAVQTTFMNAFRALGRGVVPEAESAWLFKIAENVCLSRRRSSWRRNRIESPSDFDVIEEVVPGPSRQRDELIGIEDALAGMPEQQRRAILLREWQGLSYREVAEELDISQSAVETLIFRARRSLAQGLEQPDSVKPKRKSFRRALQVIDLGSLLAAAKTLLAGSVAVKATAAAVAVTAATGTAVATSPKSEGHSPQQASRSALVAPPAAERPAGPSAAAPGAAFALAAGAPLASREAHDRIASPARGVAPKASSRAPAPAARTAVAARLAPPSFAPAPPASASAPPASQPQVASPAAPPAQAPPASPPPEPVVAPVAAPAAPAAPTQAAPSLAAPTAAPTAAAPTSAAPTPAEPLTTPIAASSALPKRGNEKIDQRRPDPVQAQPDTDDKQRGSDRKRRLEAIILALAPLLAAATPAPVAATPVGTQPVAPPPVVPAPVVTAPAVTTPVVPSSAVTKSVAVPTPEPLPTLPVEAPTRSSRTSSPTR